MSDVILDVQNLQVKFRVSKTDYLTAIEDVSFKVHRKEVLGIVGESGCGKSVTANAILRLLPPQTSQISNGKIMFQGEDLAGLSNKEMRRIRGNKISMIFQEPMTSLNPVYRIGDQMVEMYRAQNKHMSKKEAMKKAVEMLDKVGIPSPEERVKDFPHQLSGGMRQRVMIAMALSARPELLIADEPTTALDVTIQAQVLQLMKQLQEEMDTAVMLITHDMGVVAEIADSVMVMYAGEMVEYGDVKTIFNRPVHPYTKGLLDAVPIPSLNAKKLSTQVMRGELTSPIDPAPGCRFAARCPYATDACRGGDIPLKEVEPGHFVSCTRY